MPDPFNEIREEYHTKFEIVLNELKHFALKRAKEKKEECEMFNRCLAEAKKRVDEESWAACKKFGATKKRVCGHSHAGSMLL